MKRAIIYFWLKIIILLSSSAMGQSLDSLMLVSENLYQNTQSRLTFPKKNNSLSFNKIQTQDSTYTDYQIELKKAQKKATQHDIGLAFKVNAQYNFNDDLDEETNTFTSGRVKTELEWNILKSGFADNRNKARLLENEIDLLNAKKIRQQRIAWRRKFRLQYTYSINEELIALFEQKKDFMSTYFDILATLYSQRRVKREEFIKLSQQIGTLATELTNTKHFNQQLKDSLGTAVPLSLPLLEIDKKSLSKNKINQQQQRNDSLRAQNVLIQNHWTNNISLSAYANYNWLQTNINNRNFTSLGLRLRIPLRISNAKKIIATTVARDQTFYKDKTVGTQNQMLTYLNGYREKIRDLKNQFKSWQIIEERKRVIAVLKLELQDDGVGIQQLALQLAQFEILENTLRLKMQLYTALSHLYELNQDLITQPLAFTMPTQPEVLVTPSIAYDTALLIAFAKAKNLRTITFNAPEEQEIKKWESEGFIVKTNTQPNPSIVLNEWIRTEHKQLIKQL